MNDDRESDKQSASILFFTGVSKAVAPRSCVAGCAWLRECKRRPECSDDERVK